MPAPKDPVKYEEWRRKLKESHSSPEVRKKLSEAAKSRRGYKHSEETKAKIGKANKGKAPWIKGKSMPEATKEKIRQTLLGHSHSEETKQKISIKKKLFFSENPSLKEEQSRRSKVLWADLNYRRKVCEADKGRIISEEHRRKLSEAMKRYLSHLSPEERAERIAPALRANPSSLEQAIGQVLEALGVDYEPQKKIGWYVVDFYLPTYNLIIECDGDYWHNLPGAQERDKRRDAYLRKRGYNILRLKEHEIKEDPEAALLNGLKVVR